MFRKELDSHKIFKRLAKALIRLRVCAGWSEALLVAHITLLEISCCGSYIFEEVDFKKSAAIKNNMQNHPVGKLTLYIITNKYNTGIGMPIVYFKGFHVDVIN